MWLVTVSSLLLLVWCTWGQQAWQRDPLILRVYPVDTSEEERVPVREPPLKRGAGGLKRDINVYPAAGSSQLMPRIPLREPPLKRSAEFFVERRSEYPIDLLRLPLREPPLVKRSVPPYNMPLKEPPLKRSLEAILNRFRRF